MTSFVEIASERSCLSAKEAFSVDQLQPSVYKRIGKATFVELSTLFYTAVYNDEQTWYRFSAGHSMRLPATTRPLPIRSVCALSYVRNSLSCF